MICKQCRLVNKDSAAICKRCGAALGSETSGVSEEPVSKTPAATAPASISIDVPARPGGRKKTFNDKSIQPEKDDVVSLESADTAAPASMTIDVPVRSDYRPPVKEIPEAEDNGDSFDDPYTLDSDPPERRPNERRKKALIITAIAAGGTIVAGLIIACALLFTQTPSNNSLTIMDPLVTTSATSTATAAPSPTPLPSPVETTTPEATDDFSAIFEEPTDALIGD